VAKRSDFLEWFQKDREIRRNTYWGKLFFRSLKLLAKDVLDRYWILRVKVPTCLSSLEFKVETIPKSAQSAMAGAENGLAFLRISFPVWGRESY
jgi:hypothetical protein